MGSLGTGALFLLFAVVATVAALSGYLLATATSSSKRARLLFVAGFCCGLLTHGVVRGRRRRLNAMRILALRAPYRRARVRG
jgi:hypothetical protein